MHDSYHMNRLSRTRQAKIIAPLVEGNSVRGTARLGNTLLLISLLGSVASEVSLLREVHVAEEGLSGC